MEHLDVALGIMLKGLITVFLVMGVIAGGTWLSGLVFISLDKREKERKKAAESEEKAEGEREKVKQGARSADQEEAQAAPGARDAKDRQKRHEGGPS